MLIKLYDVDNCIINESAILESIDASVNKKMDDYITEAVIQSMFDSKDEPTYLNFIEAANDFLVRDGILNEGSTFILDVDSKMKKAVSMEVLKIAKANNNPDYVRLIKFNMLRKKYKKKLYDKYSARASASVRMRASEIRQSSRVSSLISQFNNSINDK